MVSIVPQLVSVALKIKLADQYSLTHKAEVDSNDLDIAEENLNRLYESLMKSEDESMILIHKMLYDLIDKLRIDQQKAQKGEQLDYSHENGAEDGGVKIDNKQTPSEMAQGSGGGESHVN
jgi:hypothetical protein